MSAKELAIPKSGSLFLEKIEKLVLWQRVAILAGLIVLMVGAAVWFQFLPQYEEISQLDEKLQGLEKKLATAKVNAAELGKFQAKMQEAEAQFKIAMRALPENQEIPSLLTSISKSGQDVGLEFLLFEPKPEIPTGVLRGDPGGHEPARGLSQAGRLFRQSGPTVPDRQHQQHQRDPQQRWAGTQHRLHRGHLQVRGAAAGKIDRTGRIGQTGPGRAGQAGERPAKEEH